jgi:uncharacterized protein (TIGR04255 family)
MARRREKLSRAPIVEAVIDIRVAPMEGTKVGDFDAATVFLKGDYPTQKPMRSVHATFSLNAEEMSQKHADVGVVFQSRDERSLAQFRLDGFTFNRLVPYTDWPTVFGEALRVWRIYAELYPQVLATRLAVRYINRMTIGEGGSLADYLTAPPILPAEVPQALREYLTRLVVQDPEKQMSAVLVQALEPGPAEATGSILLDVDAFRELRRPLKPSDGEIERIFAELREMKNRIFYASITEKAAEAYE